MAHRSSRKGLLGIIIVWLLVAAPNYAVENVKVSSYGAGHQLWFEVEDFDERDPADESSFALSDQAGAFGRSISSVNGSDGVGMIRYDFDISKAGGKGGTWYFWGRVINPNNNSDFMLVAGHPGDPVPFTQPVSGLTNNHRIFEQSDVGSDWIWAPTPGSAGEEAHTKTLQDGENTMYVISRESGAVWDVFMWTDDPDYVPTDEDYRNAGAPDLGAPSNPQPADGATDVRRDGVLTWTAGRYAAAHDVYFGTVFEDVNAADRADPRGVLVSQGQAGTSYEPEGVFDFEQTYYWRVDEVNAPPDGTIFRGPVWSFTAEPFAYAVENITATASGSDAIGDPQNTVNGAGLDADDLHSVDAADMWSAADDDVTPVWIQYEFDRVYKLHEMWVWNYNVMFEAVLGYGAKDVTVEYSQDGAEWTTLADVELARGTAAAGYTHNTTVDLEGIAARYVRLTIHDNWGMLSQYGLSEVRFYYTPVAPREPEPVDGAAGVDPEADLAWRPGREAALHEVYFGTDPNGLAMVDAVEDTGYDPGPLNLGTSYYWRIVEVNEIETVTAWEGDIWSFATQEYFLVDGFEDYTDDIDAGEAIFDTWVDGWVNETGSTVGYFESPFAETSIVNSGSQSMPLQYDNSVSPFYSEAARTFEAAQNWTVSGADTLVLYFQGRAGAFAELASGNIIMGAAGADIWNAADEFRFAHKLLNGNGTLVARVESVGNTDPWAKAGVMVRETLEAGSAFAAVYATPGNGCRYQARLETDAAAVSDTSVATPEQIAMTTPYWIKIERVGTAFNGYYSTDGETWTSMSWNPQTIPMANEVYVGLAVTSHSAGVLTSAEFSEVASTGEVSGQWQVATMGPEQPEGNAPAALYVAVEDSSGKVQAVTHPAGDAATFLGGWNQWQIPFSEFAGVNLSRVETMYIGVGDRNTPSAGGTGLVFIDDVQFGHPAESE